jgi:hypothetical protein
MKVIYLAATSSLGPASRYRIYQFRKYFEQEEIELEILPALTDRWLEAERGTGFTRHVRRLRAGAHGLVRRVQQLATLDSHDLLIVERELFPKLPGFIEKTLLSSVHSYGVELDDAIYLSPGRTTKYPAFLRGSAFVIAGNQTLAEWAQTHQPNTHVFPTCVPVGDYQPKQDYRLGSVANIGWVGLAVNFDYVEGISDDIKRLNETNPCQLQIVSSRCPAFAEPIAFVPWSESRESQTIAEFDIGVMPLPQSSFAEGKCGLKILQYMAAGVPVVASAVGVNRTIIDHGVNGLLIETPDQWQPTLRGLLEDGNLRERIGRAGRVTVENDYSTEVWGPKLVALYRQLAANQ